MAKKEKTTTEGAPGDLELLQAKHDALVDQVIVLENNLDAFQVENAVLREHLERLQAVTSQVANSASIAPPPPAPPERPTVEIGGEQYRFKIGAFRIGNKVVEAADLVGDEARLLDVLTKYPGLLEKL